VKFGSGNLRYRRLRSCAFGHWPTVLHWTSNIPITATCTELLVPVCRNLKYGHSDDAAVPGLLLRFPKFLSLFRKQVCRMPVLSYKATKCNGVALSSSRTNLLTVDWRGWRARSDVLDGWYCWSLRPTASPPPPKFLPTSRPTRVLPRPAKFCWPTWPIRVWSDSDLWSPPYNHRQHFNHLTLDRSSSRVKDTLGHTLMSSFSADSELLRYFPGHADAFQILLIWRSRLAISTKLKLYNTCILPIFLYGSDCWAMSKW